jgi:hypothetical protein
MASGNVVGHAYRPTQRNSLGRVPADYGVLHVESDVAHACRDEYLVDDALCGQLRLELAVHERLVDELDGQRDEHVCSPFRKESQRACPSSMTVMSTRGMSGRRFPFRAAATG